MDDATTSGRRWPAGMGDRLTVTAAVQSGLTAGRTSSGGPGDWAPASPRNADKELGSVSGCSDSDQQQQRRSFSSERTTSGSDDADWMHLSTQSIGEGDESPEADDVSGRSPAFSPGGPPGLYTLKPLVSLDQLHYPGSPSAAHTFTPAAAEPQLRRAFSADLVAETIALACDDADADAALCCRLSRARQTVDFVSRKRMSYGLLDKAVMTLPQALLHLRSCPSVSVRLVLGEAGPPTRHLGPGLLLAGRLLADYPEQPWFAVVGLLHVLGRLLLHPGFGAAPVWEVVGETFPVGCRFDPRISYANWFGANPDRRKRLYGTPYGMYHPGCGLADVDMCWSGDEYATEVVLRNHSKLPPHALFCLRYGSFATLGVGSAYEQLMNEQDREAMPWLLSMRAAKRLAYADVRSAADAENNAEAWLAQLQPLMDAYIPGVLCF